MTDPTQAPDPAVTALTAKVGDKVDNYTLMEQVGAGGTAIVFRGTDHVLKRDVAIKQLIVPEGESGEDTRQRAIAEAQLHKKVAASDPKLLVQYIDTINDPRGLFLISEYVDGPSLEWILQQETGPMEQRQALGIVAATAKALDALHNSGVVHRDLKPSNVLMPREGGLKLADFGLAALIAEQQTMDLGSVRYMAPEVLQGQPATPKSDLYSLGMMAYEMLAGREKFNDAFRTILRDQRNQSMRWVKWHTNARAKVSPLEQLVEGMPASLSQLVERMMEKDPARRVGSCAELMEAIRSHFASAGGEQPVPGPHAAMAPPKIDDTSATAQVPKRNKLIVIAASMLVVWVIAIGGFLYLQAQSEEEEQRAKTAALITAIENADDLINERKFEQARSAFMQIKLDHADQFDANNRRYRDDLVDAGVFKAEALKAAEDDNFITALEKSKAYRQRMEKWSDPPQRPSTLLTLIDSKNKIEQYETRANVQSKIAEIETMLEERKLSGAINTIRRTRDNSGNTIAAEDLAKLNELEDQYKLILGDEQIVKKLAEATGLEEQGERGDAIDLLEELRDDAEGTPDPRIVSLLEALNRRERIANINEEIREAEADTDQTKLLEALIELQRLQPTQALDVRITDLKIAMKLERAEEAKLNGLITTAQDLIAEILELDPDNEGALRLSSQMADAQKMVDAITAADGHMVDGEYAEAIADYRLALTFGPDSSGRIGDKIKEAAGEIHLANTEAALDKGDVVLAQTELDSAMDNHGETNEVLNLQRQIDDLRNYTVLVKAGDEMVAKKEFGRAKARYLDAKKIFDSDSINAKIRACDFGIWLQQCDQAIVRREWEEAEGALKRAEEIDTNEETKKRRDKINARVQ